MFLYNILIFIASLSLPIFAFFSKKIQLFVRGRKKVVQKIPHFEKEEKVIWIHAASLGEFEQGRPIIEQIKKENSSIKIIVSFFSPSGYEIRKNYPLANHICYLPLDSKKNARSFIKKIHPNLAIFIKYEFWPNFLLELKNQQIPTILVAGILRKNQLFFKWYGQFMRNALATFHHFFVQDNHSKNLLNSISLNKVTVSGDTRFDRVYQILQQNNYLPFIEKFTNNQYTTVAGSTWQEDEKLIIHYINKQADNNEKFIIAPHHINEASILQLKKSIHKKVVLYSEKEIKDVSKYQVLIVDSIGILTKIYSVANVAYVGGGLKTGLHNILEPATFGIPIVIGNHFSKFKEAVDLVRLKGCFSISNRKEFSSIFTQLKREKEFSEKTGTINRNYIQKNLGATQLIMNYINKQLNIN